MDSPAQSNGSHHSDDPQDRSSNPYASMVSGAQPPDIAEFELNIDPYANVIPRASRMVRAGSPDDSVESTTTRSPLLRWISIILILILVLPLMVEVFARLIH